MKSLKNHIRLSALYLWGSGGVWCVMTVLIVVWGFEGLSICSGDFKSLSIDFLSLQLTGHFV